MTSYLPQHHDLYLAEFQTKPRAALSGAIAFDGDVNYTGKAYPMYSLTNNQSRSGNLMQVITEHGLHHLINPKSSSPGSVFEHATSSLLLYGTPCGATYELVHCRASFGSCL